MNRKQRHQLARDNKPKLAPLWDFNKLPMSVEDENWSKRSPEDLFPELKVKKPMPSMNANENLRTQLHSVIDELDLSSHLPITLFGISQLNGQNIIVHQGSLAQVLIAAHEIGEAALRGAEKAVLASRTKEDTLEGENLIIQ